MPRQAYVNGRFVPHRDAAVHIEDRGYQFADGIYEVTPVHHGVIVDEDMHFERLERSLREMKLKAPTSRAVMKMTARELMRRNGLTHGFIYMQITRGVAPRDHKFPPPSTPPAFVMTTRQLTPPSAEYLDKGLKVISVPDMRWKRPDIKSVSLLPNILAKQQAIEAGAYEAWQVDAEGFVTEATSSNAWIVTKDGVVVTRKADNAILSGVTRKALIKVIEKAGLRFEERPFTVAEAQAAKEAFITASSSYVLPVTEINGQAIGNGHAGEMALHLRAIYLDYMAAQAN